MTNISDWLDTWTGECCAGGDGGDGVGKKISVSVVSTAALGGFYFSGYSYDEDLGVNITTYCVSIADTHWTTDLSKEGVVTDTVECLLLEDSGIVSVAGGTLTVSGDAEIINYDEEYGYAVRVSGDCTLTLAASE